MRDLDVSLSSVFGLTRIWRVSLSVGIERSAWKWMGDVVIKALGANY